MITPHTTGCDSCSMISSQIKGIKRALKQPELYTDDEIRLLKRSLRELYQERTDLNRGKWIWLMPKHNFKVGDLVTYKDHTNNNEYNKSDITFITNDYIVVCIHRELKTPEEAEHAVSKWREVKILVYSEYWNNLIPNSK